MKKLKACVPFLIASIALFLIEADMADGETYVSVVPSVSLNTLYDDNIYFSSSGAISDFLTQVGPGVDVTLEGKRWHTYLGYQMQQNFYYHQAARNSLNHFLDFNGWFKLPGKWDVYVEDHFIHSKDPVQIRNSIQAISYEDLKYDYNESSLVFSRRLDNGGRLDLGYRGMMFKNLSKYVTDTINHYPYISWKNWLIPQFGLGVELGNNLGLFDQSDDFQEPRLNLCMYFRRDLDTIYTLSTNSSFMEFSGQTPDYNIFDFSLGLTHSFNPSSGISLAGGYYYQHMLSHSVLKDEDGPSFNLKLWRQVDRYNFSLEFAKGYDEVYFDGEDLGFSKCYILGVKLNYFLTSALELALQASYRDDTFPHAGGWDWEVKERTWDLDTALYWHINQWVEIGMSYSYKDRDANLSEYEYLDNRILFSLRLSKDLVW